VRFAQIISFVLTVGTTLAWPHWLWAAAIPGTVDPSFITGVSTDGSVRAIAVTPDNQIVIGGSFFRVNGINRNNLARLNADGSVDLTFDPQLGPSDSVLALAVQTNGMVLIGGDFVSVNNTPRSHVARLRTDGSVDPAFDPGSGTDLPVWSIVVQTNGQVLLGGDFLTVGNQTRHRVARLNSNGSVDTNYPSFQGSLTASDSVRAMALQSDGRLLIGGNFTFVDGALALRLARLTAEGAIDPTFAVQGVNDWVYAIAVQPDGRVLVGGYFTFFRNTPHNRLVRLLADGSLDPAFDPEPGPNSAVTAIRLQEDGKILIAGGFEQVQGRINHRYARLQTTGRLDPLFEADPGANDWIESLGLRRDGSILIGGQFTSVGGQPRFGLAQLHGVDPPPFAPIMVRSPESQTVNEGANVLLSARAQGFPLPSLQWQHGNSPIPGATQEVFVIRNARPASAGEYRVIASNALGTATSTPAVIQVVPGATGSGSVDLDFYAGFGPNARVNAMVVQADGRIVIGGAFSQVDLETHGAVARLEADGSIEHNFNPGTTTLGVAHAVAVDAADAILAGGYFTNRFQTEFGAVTRFTAAGALDPGFLTFSGLSAYVYAMAPVPDRSLIAGGDFDYFFLNLQAVNWSSLARITEAGIPETNFSSPSAIVGTVRSVVRQPDERFLIGGSFTAVAGTPRRGIARLLPSGDVDRSFDPGAGVDGSVEQIVLRPNGQILLAGSFTRIDGTTRRHVARLNPNGSLDPSLDIGPGPDADVTAVAVQTDDKIVVGGRFSSLNGIPRRGVARLQPDGSLDFSFDPGTGPVPLDISAVAALTNGTILIAGGFSTVNNAPRPGLARLRAPAPQPAPPVFQAQPTNQVAPTGADITFTALASGEPALTYRWLFRDIEIPGANSWQLTVRNVQSSNAGPYRVIVQNTQGALSSSNANLTVQPPARTAGMPDLSFNTGLGPNDEVDAILLQPDGKIVIGGAFTSFDGQPRSRVARLLPNGEVDPSFNPGAGPNGPVQVLAQDPQGRILIAGEFSAIGSVPKTVLARLQPDGALDPTFDFHTTYTGGIRALAVQTNGSILVGGILYSIDGSFVPGLAQVFSHGALDTNFHAAIDPGSSITDLQLQSDAKILISGVLISPGGLNVSRLLRLLPDGRLDPPFQRIFINDVVASLELQPDGAALLGGNFTSINQQPVRRLGRIRSDGGLDPTFNPLVPPLNLVTRLALQRDGNFVAAGAFTEAGPFVRNHIARFLRQGDLDLSFHSGDGPTDGSLRVDEYGQLIDATAILDLAVESHGGILVAGNFTKFAGFSRPHLVRLYDHEVSDAVRVRTVGVPAGQIDLLWEIGVLQQAAALTGPWFDIAGAASPFRVTTANAARFYRLRLN
jgi:uncharacterized delta-60 repeat protein